jgi:hypothetical protein
MKTIYKTSEQTEIVLERTEQKEMESNSLLDGLKKFSKRINLVVFLFIMAFAPISWLNINGKLPMAPLNTGTLII